MTKVFISYSNEDSHAAIQVRDHLCSQGFDAWLDRAELRAGDILLETITDNLQRSHAFVVLLSRTSMNKPWVLAEVNIALVRELNDRMPRVLVLRLDDGPVPALLQHKMHVDARGRLMAALNELTAHLRGQPQTVPLPRQALLAAMVDGSDDELWSRLSQSLDVGEGWSRGEMAEVIRLLRETDLIVAVTLAWWCLNARVSHHGGDVINEALAVDRVPSLANVDFSAAAIRRSLARLEAEGFLQREPARNADEPAMKAWRPNGLLWVLFASARRSGLFTPMLPGPKPERLSALLEFAGLASISGPGWSAQSLPEAFVVKTPNVPHPVHVVVARHAEPARTWFFRARDDRRPSILCQHLTIANLTSLSELADLMERCLMNTEWVGYSLEAFDDLGLLA